MVQNLPWLGLFCRSGHFISEKYIIVEPISFVRIRGPKLHLVCIYKSRESGNGTYIINPAVIIAIKLDRSDLMCVWLEGVVTFFSGIIILKYESHFIKIKKYIFSYVDFIKKKSTTPPT